MKIIESYLEELSYTKIPSIPRFWHGSYQTGLKILEPKRYKSYHLSVGRPIVYAAFVKAYAACFTFRDPVDNSMEIGYKFVSGDIEDEWEDVKFRVVVSRSKYKMLKKGPCSIYTVSTKGSWKKAGGQNRFMPEVYSERPVRVLSEERYKDSEDCLKKNGVRIIIK